MVKCLPVENLLPRSVGSNYYYQLLAVMQLKQRIWELPVAVDHSQLRTIGSETKDPFDWQLPLPLFQTSCIVQKLPSPPIPRPCHAHKLYASPAFQQYHAEEIGHTTPIIFNQVTQHLTSVPKLFSIFHILFRLYCLYL